jgi:hypothetical protein
MQWLVHESECQVTAQAAPLYDQLLVPLKVLVDAFKL